MLQATKPTSIIDLPGLSIAIPSVVGRGGESRKPKVENRKPQAISRQLSAVSHKPQAISHKPSAPIRAPSASERVFRRTQHVGRDGANPSPERKRAGLPVSGPAERTPRSCGGTRVGFLHFHPQIFRPSGPCLLGGANAFPQVSVAVWPASAPRLNVSASYKRLAGKFRNRSG